LIFNTSKVGVTKTAFYEMCGGPLVKEAGERLHSLPVAPHCVVTYSCFHVIGVAKTTVGYE